MRPAPSGIWSRSLYFQIVRCRSGDELRVFAGDAIYRWHFAWGMPATVGARTVAQERSLILLGHRVAQSGIYDEGFCYLEPYSRGMLGHLHLGYNAGELTFSLEGVKTWGTFYLLRTGATLGLDAEWRVCRLAAAERVA